MPVGNPEVLAALDDCYTWLIAIEQQAHVQEHCLESRGFKSLSDWFDDMEENLHCKVIHPLMNRIYNLSGKVTSRYAFPPADPRDPENLVDACTDMLGRIVELRALFTKVCQAAETSDDYETQSVIWDFVNFTEKRIRKFENRLAKIRLVGITGFLQERMD